MASVRRNTLGVGNCEKNGDSENKNELKPRSYQLEIEASALKGNTIVYLPTGSGKTFIAGQLLRRFRKETLLPFSQGGKRSFFLVNTVALVEQQANLIQNGTIPLHAKCFSSENKVDFWKKDKWLVELEDVQVVVMTSQIFLDIVQHGYVLLSQCCLIIFDECHHAVNDHPMRQIMRQFENHHQEDLPRVLGLTATLLNSNVKPEDVEREIRKLETTFHSKIASVSSLDEVFEYSTNPVESILRFEKWISVSPIEQVRTILEELIDIVNKTELKFDQKTCGTILLTGQKLITGKSVNNKILNNLKDIDRNIETLGFYGTSFYIVFRMIQFEILKRSVESAQFQVFINFLITGIAQCRKILENAMADEVGYDKLWEYSSDKIRKLINILREYHPDNSNSNIRKKYNVQNSQLSGIIFTKERFMAKVISAILETLKECNAKEFGFLKPDFIVGVNCNPYNSSRNDLYEAKKNKRALQKFRSGLTNCLLTTNVMEEGIDIPLCTLVVKFDPVVEYRSYVQSKGRARSKQSSYIMMTDVPNFDLKLRSFHAIENIISNMIIGKSQDRHSPTAKEIETELYDQEIEPYIFGKARVTMYSAIQLLNRYCNNLPQDKFTSLQADWVLQEEIKHTANGLTKNFKVIIHLPMSSTVKEPIMGPVMANKKSAKRAAALFACRKLHQEGELNDSLLPHIRTEEAIYSSVKEIFFSHWPENDNSQGVPKAGTKARKRMHKKLYPKVLKGGPCIDSKFTQLNVHNITISPVLEGFPVEHHQSKVLFNCLDNEKSYAILTYDTLPKICDYHLFLSCGEVSVEISQNKSVITVTKAQLNDIKRFHNFLFSDVLGISKSFLVFDKDLGDNCYFIVPTTSNQEIDWRSVKTYTKVEKVVKPTDTARASMSYQADDYLLKVVSPWYRADSLSSRYIVTKVVDHLIPSSRFDNENFQSYEDYYEKKYNLSILGPFNQSLLEVKMISGRMNSLIPRAATIYADGYDKELGNFKKKDEDEFMPHNEFLIPEYCTLFSFPGDLWFKATLLPSILHRMTMLLQAEELRSLIARETSLGVVSGSHWRPLNMDMIAIRAAHKRSKGQRAKSGFPSLAMDEDTENESEFEEVDDNFDNEEHERVASHGEAVFMSEVNEIDSQYPWEVSTEPLDLDRHVNDVRVMDVECHIRFVRQETSEEGISNNPKIIETLFNSPKKPAICAPLEDSNKPLFLLRKMKNAVGPEQSNILAALTTMNSQDSINLERMEVLGDSFLKFATTLYLIEKFPTMDEGRLTAIKGQIIGNRNLFYCGNLLNIGGRMKVEKFSALSDWLVPAFEVPKQLENVLLDAELPLSFLLTVEFDESEKLEGTMKEDTWEKICCDLVMEEVEESNASGLECFVKQQYVQDKAVADCVEALIGVYLHSGGIDAALKFLSFLKILPAVDAPEKLMTLKTSTPYTQGECTVSDIDFLLNYGRKEVENILGYNFKDPSLLLQALSHPSFSNNRITDCYQRLELLGDAVLDFLVTAEIFERNKNLTPGDITDLRSALVNNITFACFTVRLGLQKYLQAHSQPLEDSIIHFVKSRKNQNHVVTHEVLYLLEEDGVIVSDDVEVPKALGDIFESLAGAVFLDSGRSLETVWRIFGNIMKNEIEAFSNKVPKQSLRLLYEATHASPKFCKATYLEEMQRFMVPLKIHVNRKPVLVHGFGKTKKLAKLAAAKTAVRLLGLVKM